MSRNIIETIYCEPDNHNIPIISFYIPCDIKIKLTIVDFDGIDYKKFREALTDENKEAKVFTGRDSDNWWQMTCKNKIIKLYLKMNRDYSDSYYEMKITIDGELLIDIFDELIELDNCMDQGIKYIPVSRSIKYLKNCRNI